MIRNKLLLAKPSYGVVYSETFAVDIFANWGKSARFSECIQNFQDLQLLAWSSLESN